MDEKFIPWRERPENREQALKQKRDYYAINKDRYSEQRKEFRALNKEHYSQQQAKFHQKHKKRKNLAIYLRKKALKTNQAKLSKQFMPQIEAFYTEARRLTEETGVNYVVDHYWPIKGKGSCGLHVPWNLRVITQRENDSKGNKEPEDTWSTVTTEQEK